MRVLIFGGTGMLGHKLVQSWKDKFEVWATVRGTFSDHSHLEIFSKDRLVENFSVGNSENIVPMLDKVAPDVVVNAIGVIKQVPKSKDVVETLTINSIFPHKLVEAANERNIRVINISTDCVFSGDKGMYVEEDTSDATDLYGRSKSLGEVVGDGSLTLRTSIIGHELGSSHSLVDWFLSNRGGSVKGFTKAIYSGFPTIVLSEILAEIITENKELSGLYHVSSDAIDKFSLLQMIGQRYGAEVAIEPFDDFVIDRSLDSKRFRSATGFSPQSWPEMIDKMAIDFEENNKIYGK